MSRKAISTLPNLHKYQHLTFLFSFLMCLLNPESIQETWLVEKKTNLSVRHVYIPFGCKTIISLQGAGQPGDT